MIGMVLVESVQLGRLLKSPIFVVQKAAASKNRVEFCLKSIGGGLVGSCVNL